MELGPLVLNFVESQRRTADVITSTPRHGENDSRPTASMAHLSWSLPRINEICQVEFAEFDSEGLSALEKIYLFSRSRASFQRVFIAHALPGFLRAASADRSRNNQQSDSATATQPQEGLADADVITPAEAVEYVLPLLNGLAMDDGALYTFFHMHELLTMIC